MKKFSEIEYVRPDMEAEQEKVRAYTKALKEAKSYKELLQEYPIYAGEQVDVRDYYWCLEQIGAAYCA